MKDISVFEYTQAIFFVSLLSLSGTNLIADKRLHRALKKTYNQKKHGKI